MSTPGVFSGCENGVHLLYGRQCAMRLSASNGFV